ncbi:MAG: hypothetical protein LBV33_08395, partial [Lachnospiraceae bacterium]|nr:hypothetical protein [Lachnospiraceae bacterium]
MINQTDKRVINYIWWFLLTVSTSAVLLRVAGSISGGLPGGGTVWMQAGIIALLLVIFAMAGLIFYFSGKAWGGRPFKGR